MFGVPLRNLGLFAAVHVVVTAAALAIVYWLETQFAFGGSSMTWIPPFAAACIWAGNSYAKDSGWTWTREDRRNLAMAYAAVSFFIGLVFAIAYLAFTLNAPAILGTFWGIFVLFFGGLFGSLLSYALARFLLGQVVRQKGRQAQ